LRAARRAAAADAPRERLAAGGRGARPVAAAGAVERRRVAACSRGTRRRARAGAGAGREPAARGRLTRGPVAPAAAALRSVVLDRHRLERREAVQRLEALLAAVARALDAAEWQLDASAGPVVVDEHLAAAQAPRHAQGPAAVARPDAGHQPVGRAI